MAPKHSIIVPAYNTGNTIHKCIDSILSQTFPDWELIVVDDGSKDNTPAIIDDYAQKDTRIHIIHITNGGVSNARNVGLDVAKGEYIMFMDADDWIEKDYLQNVENYMDDNSDMYIVGITQDFEFEDGNLSRSKVLVSPVHRVINKNTIGAEFGYLYNTINVSSACLKTFRSEIIKQNKIRFDKRMIVLEDFHFVLSYLICKPKITLVPFVGYHYMLPLIHNPIARRGNNDLYPSIHLILEKFDETCSILSLTSYSKEVFLLACKDLMGYVFNQNSEFGGSKAFRLMADDVFFQKHVKEMIPICGGRFKLKANLMTHKLYCIANLVNKYIK